MLKGWGNFLHELLHLVLDHLVRLPANVEVQNDLIDAVCLYAFQRVDNRGRVADQD